MARVIKINDYLAEFPPTIVGGDAIKLPDGELLDLLEFGIPIKWQRQMKDGRNLERLSRFMRAPRVCIG